jgi:hypothetical protein
MGPILSANPELPGWPRSSDKSAPKDLPPIVPWAEENVSASRLCQVEALQAATSPHGRIQILEWADDGFTRKMHVRQTGPVGRLGRWRNRALPEDRHVSTNGDIQYNWQNDEKADERWKKRIEKILRACKPIMDIWPHDRSKVSTGLIIFAHLNLTVQGVFTARNVASDSIRFQINEEVHDTEGWLPGRLQQAYNRTTAFWDSLILNISNAGEKATNCTKLFWPALSSIGK